MTELKPCPFCGSRDVIPIYSWYVRCVRCGAYGATRQTKIEAIEAWNRRAEDGKAD